MSFVNKTNCFCYKYLSEKCGIELKTIQIMIDNGFDSVHSLLAVRVDTDLNQIPDLLLGQKSILREALQDLQNEYKELKFKLKIDNSFTRRLLEESLINHQISTPFETPKQSPINTSTSLKSTSKQTKTESQKVVKTIEDKIQTISEKLGLRSAKKQKKVTNGDQNITSGSAFSAKKCGVCGRPAKQERCRQENGLICVQCLDFYKYYYKTSGQLVCDFEDNCFIDKKIRNNCRRCRWNQCLQIIGMTNEENLSSGSTISAVEEYLDQTMETTDYVSKSQPYINLTRIKLPQKALKSYTSLICKVCGDQLSKSHTNYGVVVCSGCANFFRRVNRKQIIITDCIESDKCVINPKTRNNCKSCRFQACLLSGMTYTSKHKANAEEVPVEQNEEQEIEEEAELPDYSSDISDSTGFNYTLIHCGRTPDSPMNQKKSKQS